MSLGRRLLTAGLVFVTIIAIGGVGYVVIEGWSWQDALYMAIITVTTVGYGEVYALSQAGRLFTSMLILLGVGGITYAFGTVADYLIAGEVRGFLEGRKMTRRIGALEGHYIVCGFGRVGQQVCLELHREGRPFVVVEANIDAAEQARAQGYLVVYGDAGDDQILREAGIERARGLVAAVDSDATNLYVVLSARALNRDLTIVTRADSDDTVAKLLRGGADRVISPYSLGGSRMAQLLIRPDVVDFLDVVMHDQSLELFLENVTVEAGSRLDGCTVGEARVRETSGANLLGLKRGEGIILSPDPSTRLTAGDVLVALGTRDQLQSLAQLFRARDRG